MKMKTHTKRIPPYILLVAFVSAQFASALTVPELPAPAFVDTEVSTNVAMRAWGENTRQLTVSLQFDATPSNNVEVAFGRDESGDGDLFAEETGLAVGWDCGQWFIASDAAASYFAADPVGAETRKTLSFKMDLKPDGSPRALKLSDGKAPLAFPGLDPAAPPAWMFSTDWNRLKVVARGADAQNETITVKLSDEAIATRLSDDGVVLILR
ncbi:MAG: hypothetical protein ACOX9C_10985 [Kiritimatiellia bacterium]